MTTTTDKAPTGTDVALRDRLMEVRSVEEAVNLFASLGFDPSDDEADGIRSIEVVDKETLTGVPFLMLRWQWNDSDKFDSEFVSVECMKGDGTIVVINDGSTGIYKQLRELTDHRYATNHPEPNAGRFVKRGLKRSDYETEVTVNGKTSTIEASTYYLAY